MSEVLRLNFDGKSEPIPRDRAALFLFVGELAVYDHVYVVRGDEDDLDSYYIFKSHEDFEEIADFMEKNEYPICMKQVHIAADDVERFDLVHFSDVRSEPAFPEDWVK